MLHNKLLIEHELDSATLADLLTDPINVPLFEGTNNEYLSLKLKISEYIPTYEGESIQIIEGQNIPIVDVPLQRYSFEISPQEGRYAAWFTLNNLWTTRLTNVGPYTLIKIKDYINPDANKTGFVVRNCILQSLSLEGGFVSTAYDLYGGTPETGIARRVGKGFKAKFIQIN